MGLCAEPDTKRSLCSWGGVTTNKLTFPLTPWGHMQKGQYGASLPFLFHLLVSLT